jgi:serine protease Do
MIGQARRVFGAVGAMLVLLVGGSPAMAQRPVERDFRQDATTSAPIERGYAHAPAAFGKAVDRVKPSLVTIETFGGLTGRAALQSNKRDRSGRQRRIGGIARPGEGPTTGLIISPDGYIITSTFNFIRKQQIITVILSDGSQHVARLLGRDDLRKLCVLKIDNVSDLPTANYAPVARLQPGQWAISMGVGYGGDEPAVSVGIISALNRISGRAVQTDANISPANYGGPLLDIAGRVIGICVPLSPRRTETAAGVEWYDSGIGFAVPLADAEALIDAMKAGKTVQRGLLGIRLAGQTPDGGGVMVDGVALDSGAAEAGVLVGDVITAADGQAVADINALRLALGRRVAGDSVELTIRRAGQTITLTVTLRPGPLKFADEADDTHTDPAESVPDSADD